MRHRWLYRQAQSYPAVVLFVLYLLIAALVYSRAYNSLLIDDGMAGLIELKKQGWAGWFNSFGFPSLYYTHDFVVLLVYAVVGKSSMGWFLVMLLLHGLNAALSFKFFHLMYQAFTIKHGTIVALAGSALFLLSPYQTENVVWAATLHYSIALLLFLIISIILINCLQQGKIKTSHIIQILCLHTLAITSLETALFFPAVYFVFGAGLIASKKTSVTLQQLLLKVMLPLTILTALYFVTTYVTKGHWVPHYGAQHLDNANIGYYTANTARHTVKLLSYMHFADYKYRELVYTFCERWKVVLLCTALLIGIAALIVRLRNSSNGLTVFAMLAVGGFLILLPALNMYFMYLFTPENDRLSYFYSVFVYQILSLVLVSISVYAGVSMLILFCGAGIFFLHQQVVKWHDAGFLHDNLINSFAWIDAPQVYVLNAPSNYKGIYEFRNDKRLPWAIHFFKDVNMEGRITSVLSAAYVSTNDSSTVTVLNDSSLQVNFSQNGGWLMHERFGASNYSTNEYSVTVDQWSPTYQVVFHNKPEGAVYIYAGNNAFKAVEGF